MTIFSAPFVQKVLRARVQGMRQRRGRKRVFIVRPGRLARSIGRYIARLLDQPTESSPASPYIPRFIGRCSTVVLVGGFLSITKV